MLAPRASTIINRQCIAFVKSRKSVSDNTKRFTSNFSSDEPEMTQRTLKKWYESPQPEKTFLSFFNLSAKKKKRLILPRDRIRALRLGIADLTQWYESSKIKYVKDTQKFITQRHATLGCDLAAAHFLVYRGGKVKFHGQEDWKVRDDDIELKNLPDKYNPSWRLSHIDASTVPLYYEGIENFQHLNKVIWADFSKNPNLNDWCIDRLSGHLSQLEYLNISECERVTENSLEALYKLAKLKTLIITDWHKLPSFELSCNMLEDCIPGLTIEIRAPEEKKPVEEENDMRMF